MSDDSEAPYPPHIPSPFDEDVYKIMYGPRTLVEQRINTLSALIRDKLDWWKKVQVPEIVDRWRTEMREQDHIVIEETWGGRDYPFYRHSEPVEQWPREPVSDAQLDYIFDELVHDASLVDEPTGIYRVGIHSVYASNTLIPADVRDQLLEGVAALEDVPEDEKDWHPGSNNQVLDLVHPSLYPLRIGHSTILDRGSPSSEEMLTWEAYMKLREPGFGDLSNERYRSYFVSKKFQWLPTDFVISPTTADGGVTATPLGYINNLHPTNYGRLYPTISSILARFVPLWERVLSDIAGPAPAPAIPTDPNTWYGDVQGPDFDTERKAWIDWYWAEDKRNLLPHIPEPAPFAPPPHAGRTPISLRGRTLQVIVKLATIILTPQNRAYPGGSWHVEGMANERIVATGLYYYALENITPSRLAFRAAIGGEGATDEFPRGRSDFRGYALAYGLDADAPLCRALGAVRARAGRCVAFPNAWQHRVEPFELEDKSKPGHRKILCFFLVDPGVRIPSTTDVPPQQEEWALEAADACEGLRALPQELWEIVMGHVRAGTMARGEAEEVRAELMRERSAFVEVHNEDVFELPFNMCEH